MSTVAGFGLAAAPPHGWDVRIFRRLVQPPEQAFAVLHAATFPLPAERGDYGDGAVELMSASDVFVALVGFGPDGAGRGLFAMEGFPDPLTANDLSRTSLQRALPGQAGVQRFFSHAGQAWCLYVVAGSYDDRSRLVARANALVQTLEVQL